MSKSQPAKPQPKKASPPTKAGAAEPKAKSAAAKPAPKHSVAKADDEKPANDHPKRTNGDTFVVNSMEAKREAEADAKLSPFLRKQKERLLQLRDNILDSMNGVAKDTLRSRAEGSEASAFGMHQADAGSDAYDRDFALSLLSQEQDALYEIEEALKRVEQGAYGVCEMSGKPIAHARLEAIPFARYTVECQAQIERQTKAQRSRTPVTSLFGLTDAEDGAEGEEEEPATESKE
ncbi:MAG TPA: TraR/DksA C4-type zinc finger protein [Chthoniobacteraceae bacterium]|jgi:RNA polymerase-binding transcription factor DksA